MLSQMDVMCMVEVVMACITITHSKLPTSTTQTPLVNPLL